MSLVAWYKLDENSSTTSVDASGNGNTLTLLNSPTWVDGKSGRALQFGGTSVATVASVFGMGNTSVSMCCWVYLSSSSMSGTFMKVGAGSSYGYSIGVGNTTIDNAGNHLVGLFETYRHINTSANIGTGWHHVALVIESSGTPRFYLDGANLGLFSGTNAGTPTTATSIGAGDNTGSGRQFSGIVDDVRFYNHALSATEISNIKSEYNGGLVAQYKINEGSGSTIADSVNGFTGTLQNSPTWVAGRQGYALSFNGSTQYVSSSLISNVTTNFSVSCWVKWTGTTTSGGSAIFYNGNGGSNGYGIMISNGSCAAGNKITVLSGGVFCDALTSSVVMPSNVWTHLCVTHLGSWKLYVNGNIAVNGGSSTPLTPTGNSYIAGSGSNYFSGAIDELTYWARALTATEVGAIYNQSFGQVME